ncbi:Gfo/Idh/MocA family oxidoreductase [Termitidicoccus mucosus]|uniref:Oxidoreductase n=1 Tax=Termitidicoccus mucosus TaxID=1184151 RepID=A0A178IKV5_9BACT|nr:oxidoreductase [Opitutaceae bacterium TSB47]
MRKIRFGIVGMGNIGASHARALLDGRAARAELGAVCDTDPARLDAWRGAARVFSRLDEMLASDVLDALLVATPHFGHVEAATAGLRSGRHVLVEKPIAVHKADAVRMLAAHTDKSLRFGVMFNQRTNPAFRKIRRLLQAGELGAPRRVQWTLTDWFRPDAYYRSSSWRATWGGEGGGVLVNQSPHQLDLLCWLFGLPGSTRAFCHFGKYHEIEVEDEVTAYLEWPGGATGVFITSTGEAPGTNRLEIACDRGRVVYENGRLAFTRNETPAPVFCRETDEPFGVPPVWNADIPVGGAGGQHAEIMQNFADSILDGAPLIAPAEEGLQQVELANAMLLSTWLGRTVELPLDGVVFAAELETRIARSAAHRPKNAPATR